MDTIKRLFVYLVSRPLLETKKSLWIGLEEDDSHFGDLVKPIFTMEKSLVILNNLMKI